MATVDQLISEWSSRKASLRCSDVVRGLTELGFVVKPGKSPGHKTYSHPHLRHFFGASFNCGHGKNPEVLSRYIGLILKVLRQYQEELTAIEKGK